MWYKIQKMLKVEICRLHRCFFYYLLFDNKEKRIALLFDANWLHCCCWSLKAWIHHCEAGPLPREAGWFDGLALAQSLPFSRFFLRPLKPLSRTHLDWLWYSFAMPQMDSHSLIPATTTTTHPISLWVSLLNGARKRFQYPKRKRQLSSTFMSILVTFSSAVLLRKQRKASENWDPQDPLRKSAMQGQSSAFCAFASSDWWNWSIVNNITRRFQKSLVNKRICELITSFSLSSSPYAAASVIFQFKRVQECQISQRTKQQRRINCSKASN